MNFVVSLEAIYESVMVVYVYVCSSVDVDIRCMCKKLIGFD